MLGEKQTVLIITIHTVRDGSGSIMIWGKITLKLITTRRPASESSEPRITGRIGNPMGH